jgi:hypothetical protein
MNGPMAMMPQASSAWTFAVGLSNLTLRAVLTPTDPGKEWPTSFGNIPLTDNFDHWRAGKGVLLSTCRRFKGLEADALVLAGIPKPDTKKYFSNADYYVAASRGKHLLTVIATEAF